MGPIALPDSGTVCIDTQIAIYSLEHGSGYESTMSDFWRDAQRSATPVITSELTLMEVMVRPLRLADHQLQQAYQTMLLHGRLRMMPITQAILFEAARLRALIPSLRTPDAIRAATAVLSGCALFLTNDPGFRQVPGLPLTLLSDVLRG